MYEQQGESAGRLCSAVCTTSTDAPPDGLRDSALPQPARVRTPPPNLGLATSPAPASGGGADGLEQRRVGGAKLLGQAPGGDTLTAAAVRPGEQRAPRAGQA